MSVRSILEGRKGDLRSVLPEETLNHAISMMGASKIGAVLVMDIDERLSGIVTERDVVRLLSEHGASALDHTVVDIMTPKPITCSINDDAYDAIQKMNIQKCRHLPVMENHKVVGMVSSRDIMESLWQRATEQDRRQLIAQIALA